MASQAQIKASKKYNKENVIQFTLKLNKNTDSKLIEKLNNVPSKLGYIKDLIRKDIAQDIALDEAIEEISSENN